MTPARQLAAGRDNEPLFARIRHRLHSRVRMDYPTHPFTNDLYRDGFPLPWDVPASRLIDRATRLWPWEQEPPP